MVLLGPLNSPCSPGLVAALVGVSTRCRVLASAAVMLRAGLIPAIAWVAGQVFPIASRPSVARVPMARS